MCRKLIVTICFVSAACLFLPSVANGYGLWIEDSMMQIFPDSRPDSYPDDPNVSISLAKGEYESFQVIILPPSGTTLSNVSVEISDLTKGSDTIDAENIKWYMVGYVWIDDYYVSGKEDYFDDGVDDGWWPDLIIPAESFDVDDSDRAQPIWVTVYAPPETKPGTYTGTLTVTVDGNEPNEVDIIAEVYNFTLAKGPGHCRTTLSLPRSYNYPNVGYGPYADFMLEHRLNVDWHSSTGTPTVENLEHYYDMGQNSYCIRKVAKGQDLTNVDTFLSALEESEIGDILRDMAFFYGYDEAGPLDWGDLADCFADLEDDYPDIERLTTASIPYYPLNDWHSWGRTPVGEMESHSIDWICPWTPEYDYADGEDLRDEGYQMWSYVCRVPETTKPKYANFYTHYPVIESRVIWWQMYHQKMDGFLYWDVRNWASGYPTIDPNDGPLTEWEYESEEEGGPYGNGVLLYPGVAGPIASMRLENIRDGIEDYEYLWMLGEMDSVANSREECEDVAWALHDTTSFTHSPSTVHSTRNNIADLIIEQLKAHGPSPSDQTAGVDVNTNLSWTAGYLAADTNGHDVYFGASFSSVNDANTSTAGIYKGRQSSTSYEPGTMDSNTTYYWRIDEIEDANNNWKGDVWSFTTEVIPVPAEYTERYDEWSVPTESTWLTKGLSGYGVPANAVVEIGIRNSNTSAERNAGVRAVGSSLDRKYALHEAEDGGWDVMTFHVQANASSQIEYYGDDDVQNKFYLLGWWSIGTYVEKDQSFDAPTTGAWGDVSLSGYGVGANQYCEIMIRNSDTSNENWVGVRKNGSSLDRMVQLQEAEDGGRDMVTMIVQADASGTIEAYREDTTSDNKFYLMGYWTTPPGTYTEKFVNVGKPANSATWEDKNASSYGVPANAVCEMVFGHGDTGNEDTMGVRKNGSSLSRLFNLHEPEGGGRDIGRMHVTADASSIIEIYFSDRSDTGEFYLTGYWE